MVWLRPMDLEPSSGFLNNLSNQSILQKHSSVNMTRQYHCRRLDSILILSV